jgi:DNA-3-methyladenine glycosylase II
VSEPCRDRYRHRQPLPGPLDLAASLAGFRRSGDDLIDRWDGRVWLRAVPLDGRMVAVAGRAAGTMAAPALEVEAEAGEDPAPAAQALASVFVADQAALAELARRDPVVARLDRRFPGVRPVLQRDLLTAMVRSISAQQVNLAWAATIRSRLARRFGRRHLVAGREVFSLVAAVLAATPPAELRALQFTSSKAASITSFAAAVASGAVGLAELAARPDEEVVERLTAFPGVGRWTAEWFLARTLGRPRVVAGDLGVRKAVGAAYFDGRMPAEAEVRAATAHWGRAAGVAQQLLLHWLAESPQGERP